MAEEKTLLERLADRLIKARKKKGLTQAEAAKAMKLGARTLWTWENAERLPSGRHLEILASYYETTTSALLK